MTDDTDRYWSVDVPGLTEDQASQLVEWVKEMQFGWFGNAIAADPEKWYSMTLDPDTARTVLEGLRRAGTTDNAVAEDLAEWLGCVPPDE